MAKRVTALLLCVLLLVTMLPTSPAAANGNDQSGSNGTNPGSKITITADGTPVNEITISPCTDVALTARSDGNLLESCQWQILADAQAGIWVDIYGENEPVLSVRYAMVASLLDENNQVWVRCVRQSGAAAVTDDAVCVTVTPSETVIVPGPEPVMETFPHASAETPAEQMDSDTPVDESLKKYILSIEYVYADSSQHSGDMVAPSWSAEISSAQAYHAEIDSPTIPGYTPDRAAVIFDYPEGKLSSHVQITVKYSPASVGYTVKHYWQNVEDDNYTEHEVEAKQGLTESPVSKNLSSGENGDSKYPGFVPLPYVSDEIAADGSTVVEIYYDRAYYLMHFELDGGHGTTPVYARYGTPISVDDPEKAGYEFNGWTDADGNPVSIPDTMPVGGGTYYAAWNPLNAQYTVSYWIVNEDGTRSLIGSYVTRGVSGSSVDGKDNLGETDSDGNPVADRGVICGEESAHIHTEQCCKEGLPEHNHTLACFADNWQVNVTSGVPTAAISAVNDGADNPESGYLYVVNEYTANENFWPKLYLEDNNGQGTYYWLEGSVAGVTYGSKDQMVAKYADSEELGIGDADNHRAYKYRPKTTCGYVQHIHSKDCLTCAVHEHDETCYYDTKHLEYVDEITITLGDGEKVTFETDKDVTIKGDGTTIVNVYYQYKIYTIRYVYARRSKDANHTGQYQIATSTGNGALENGSWSQKSTTTLPVVTDPNKGRELTAEEQLQQSFTQGNYTYYYIALTARFGSDITDKWPGANVGSIGTEAYWGSWAAAPTTGYRVTYGDAHANIVGPYPIMSDDMVVKAPVKLEDGTWLAQNMNAWWAGSGENVANHAYHNYFELVWGEKVEAGDTIYEDTKTGKKYRLEQTFTFTAAHNGTTRVDPVQFDGYVVINEDKKKQENSNNYLITDTCSICQENNCRYHSNYYYDAKTYKLSFWNYDDYLTDGTGADVPYGELLSLRFDGDANNDGANDIVVKPEKYPASLEPGAYEFEGWYTSPGFEPDTRVDPDTMTMPAENIRVYAHWVPVTHKVTVYNDKDADTPITIIEVPHGSTVPKAAIPADPENGSYTFGGWFYLDANGEEQAFDFAAIPVESDLNIYAKWKSDLLKTVTVRYVTIKDGVEVEIAPTETFDAYVNALKTYEAKTGDQLFESGYYPTVASKSVTVSEDDGQNVLTFEYVHKPAAPYTVYYWIVDENGTKRPAFRNVDGKPEFVGDTTIGEAEAYVKNAADNTKAVVTEDYLLAGVYVPDALQKRLIITADIAKNVIEFIYVYNPDQAYYTVNHYILKPGLTESDDLADYDRYTYSQILGNVGETYSAKPITIPGTTFSATITQAQKGENTWNGENQTLFAKLQEGNVTTLNFFYTRNSYPYRVRYVETGSNIQLRPDKTGDSAQYGATITENAPDIAGYKVDAAVKNHTIQIGGVATNTITFYYTRLTGDLKISKTVALDPEQLQENPLLTLPEGAEERPFQFVVSADTAFHKQSFDYTITHKNGTVTNGAVSVEKGSHEKVLESIELCDGESIVIHGLALGQYQVAELYTVGYKTTINNVEMEQATLSLEKEQTTVTANVTNTYPFFTGDLALGKEIVKHQETDPSGAGEIFTYHITVNPNPETLEVDRVITYVTLDENGNSKKETYTIGAGKYEDTHQFSLLLKAGTKVMVEDVPAGTFTVVETIDQEHYVTDYYTVSYDKQTGGVSHTVGKSETVNGIIRGGHTTQVGYTNTYKKGSLTIQKLVELEVDYDEWESDIFTFRVTGTTALPDGNYTIQVNGVSQTATVANGQVTLNTVPVEVRRANGWSNSVLLANLPAGIYAVEEIAAGASAEDLNKYTVEPSGGIVSGLKLPGTDVTAAFTNRYKRTTGALTIRKEIVTVENGAEIDPAATFEFTVTMPDDWYGGETDVVGTDHNGQTHTFRVGVDGTFTVTLKHGESMTFPDMPIGVYKVEEAPVVGYEDTYQVTDGSSNPLDVIQVYTDQTTTVKCINRYPVFIGELTIQRSNAEDDEQVFVYEVYNTDTGETITVTVVGNGTTKIQNLPYGEYTVTQRNDWSWRYGDVAIPVKIDKDGAAVAFGDVPNKQWLDGNSPLVKNRWWNKKEDGEE